MNKGINLISLEATKIAREQKVKSKVKSASLFFVIFFIVLAGLAFGLLIFFNQQYKNNEKKIAGLKEQVKSLEKNESYLVTIADRVKHVKTILDSRKTYAKTIEDLEKIYVAGLEVRGLDFGARGEMKVEGMCLNIVCLTELNNKVEEIKAEKKYQEVLFESVSRSAAGSYNINLSFKK
jgi:hypothetical protein